jgi:hypothetical protein
MRLGVCAYRAHMQAIAIDDLFGFLRIFKRTFRDEPVPAMLVPQRTASA